MEQGNNNIPELSLESVGIIIISFKDVASTNSYRPRLYIITNSVQIQKSKGKKKPKQEQSKHGSLPKLEAGSGAMVLYM